MTVLQKETNDLLKIIIRIKSKVDNNKYRNVVLSLEKGLKSLMAITANEQIDLEIQKKTKKLTSRKTHIEEEKGTVQQLIAGSKNIFGIK